MNLMMMDEILFLNDRSQPGPTTKTSDMDHEAGSQHKR
jgi:hypothetical protein